MEIFERKKKVCFFHSCVIFTHSGDGAREKYSDTNLKKEEQADLVCAEHYMGAAQWDK